MPVVKLGARGSLLMAEGKVYRQPALPVPVVEQPDVELTATACGLVAWATAVLVTLPEATSAWTTL